MASVRDMIQLSRLDRRGPVFWTLAGVVGVGVVGVADVATGPELSFSLFYLIPVVCVTWFAGGRAGLAISVLAAIVWFGADAIDGQMYSNPFIRYWNAAVRFGFFVVVIRLLPALQALERERIAARIDDLTGAANRRHCYEAIDSELRRSQRYEHPFTIVYLDLDGFKDVNDRSGHRMGDKVLCAVVTEATTHSRQTDLVARVGGDEFVVLLPEIGADAARVTADKLRAALLDAMQRGGWPVTFSIGVVTYSGGKSTADELVKLADELMYTVKRNGKNGVAYTVVGA